MADNRGAAAPLLGGSEAGRQQPTPPEFHRIQGTVARAGGPTVGTMPLPCGCVPVNRELARRSIHPQLRIAAVICLRRGSSLSVEHVRNPALAWSDDVLTWLLAP